MQNEMRAILMLEKGVKIDDVYLARLHSAGAKDLEILTMLGIIMCTMSDLDFETLKTYKDSMSLKVVKREEGVQALSVGGLN